MKPIDKQKSVANEVIKKLETFDPTCILAGGAPRDWYFGNTATDLDFFVHWRPDFRAQKHRYEELLASLGFRHVVRKGNENEEVIFANYKRNPNLIAVYEFMYKGEVVQVMFMDSPTFYCVVDQFPFGICQAWYKYGEVKVSDEFMISVQHKILRLLNELYSDADGYIEKIKAKFPDYLYLGR